MEFYDQAADLDQLTADVARLTAELVRVERERDDAVSALRSMAMIARGACASLLAAADVYVPTVPAPSPAARLAADVWPTDTDVYRAPVVHLPLRHDKQKAAAADTTTADHQSTEA